MTTPFFSDDFPGMEENREDDGFLFPVRVFESVFEQSQGFLTDAVIIEIDTGDIDEAVDSG